GLEPLLLETGFVLFSICSAFAICGPPPNWLFATTKSEVIASLASAVDVLKTSLEAADAVKTANLDSSAPPGPPTAAPTPVAPQGASGPQEPAYGSAAAQLYNKGDAAGLAALAKAARDPDERLALEWASLRSDAHPSVA